MVSVLWPPIVRACVFFFWRPFGDECWVVRIHLDLLWRFPNRLAVRSLTALGPFCPSLRPVRHSQNVPPYRRVYPCALVSPEFLAPTTLLTHCPTISRIGHLTQLKVPRLIPAPARFEAPMASLNLGLRVLRCIVRPSRRICVIAVGKL